MKLSDQETAFLEKRKKLVGSWNYAGVFLILVVAGLTLYLYMQSPLLINPIEVKDRLQADSIDSATQDLMLFFLPLLMNTICFLLFMLIGMMYMAFGLEKKYQVIVDRMRESHGE
ncbi:MAG: hypothetical protein R3C11_04985 [Planctomycetaceae bacterium]